MPITENDVVVGGCYETLGKQQRRVVAIKDCQVTYESWGGNVQNTSPPLPRNTAKIGTFAGAVDKSIICPADLPPMPTTF